jgi:DNA-binding NarL/FixJ family response regulator
MNKDLGIEGSEEPSIGVLVVEDDAMVRDWLRLALEGSRFRIVGEAGTAAEAESLIDRRRPELLLVDYRLPDGVGTELVRALRQRGLTTPVLLMTAAHEAGFNEAARAAAAQGSVLKTGRSDELLQAMTEVANGGQAFDPRHPERPRGQGTLSPREREVLRRVATGETNRVIAAELGVGEETVKTLLARTYAKLGVSRRAEAVSAAHERGIL